MSVAYVIQWKSQVNGRAGRGTKQFERHEAEQLAEELNREYPDILHEVVKAMPETEREAEPEQEPETEMVEADDEHVVVE
jgi:hypothetical protein